MAVIATSNRVALNYIPEVTLGLVPANPAFTGIPFTGEGLNANSTFTTSNEIRADREVADSILTDQESAGNIDFELTHTTYDWVLEAALQDVFTTNVLVNGLTASSFTIQKQFQDLATPLFQLYKGMQCKTLTLNIPTGAIVTASSSWLGMSSSISSVDETGVTYAVPTSSGSVLTSVTDISAISLGGATQTAVSNISLTIENNLRAQKAVGVLGSIGIGSGQLAVSGQIDLYFEDLVQYTAFQAATAFAISFTLTSSAGTTYAISLPRNKYTSATVTAGGANQDIMVNFAFTSLHDPVTGNTIQITKA